MVGREFALPLLFDPALSRFERTYVGFFGAPILGLRIRARYLLPVIHRFKGRPPERIADAGSGRGLFTFYLARTFPEAQVIGMDTNEEQIKRNNIICTRLGYDNCRFVVQDVTTLQEGAYDLILSTDNLEHLEEDRKQCAVFFNALRPGGSLLLHVPHVTRNLFGWRRPNFTAIEGHVRPGYTLNGLTSMLEAAGFAVEEAAYSYSWIETLANDLSYLITGGHEKRKALYAVAFPFLLVLAQLDWHGPRRDGSGVVVSARREPSLPR